jgi:hypothetical protein
MVYGPLRTAADNKVLTLPTESSTNDSDEHISCDNTNTVSVTSDHGATDTSTASKNPPETVSELITMIADAYPQTRSHLLDCEEKIRPSVRVVVDGDKASFESQLDSSADIQLFPAMRGGSGCTVTKYDS